MVQDVKPWPTSATFLSRNVLMNYNTDQSGNPTRRSERTLLFPDPVGPIMLREIDIVIQVISKRVFTLTE